MSDSDQQLLLRYVDRGDQAAFEELLKRHVDLMYSAALRQMPADPHTAEELTLAVFADLARKARRLARHPNLEGWLYTAIRLAAIHHHRTRARRAQRETLASMALTTDCSDPSPDWDSIRPVLDEAMHDLSERDRDAVLLRYFQGKPIKEVATRLGLSEDAARMRISRALDRLRTALNHRGIPSTAAALAAALGVHAVTPAPEGLAARIPIPATGPAPGFLPTQVPALTAITAVAIAVMGIALYIARPAPDPGNSPQAADIGADFNATQTANAAVTAVPVGVGTETSATINAGSPFELSLVTSDTGQPLPNVTLIQTAWSQTNVSHQTNRSDRFGHSRLTVPPDTQRLRIWTVADGFADTLLQWSPGAGHPLPRAHVARIDRAIPIGGRVVDPNGEPIEGATIRWGTFTGMEPELHEGASHRVDSVETVTGPDGRWEIHRLAGDVLGELEGWASASGFRSVFQQAPQIDSSGNRLATRASFIETLRRKEHVFRLDPSTGVTGVVVDDRGAPVAGAIVRLPTSAPGTTTDRSGRFDLGDQADGANRVIVEADGFATTQVVLPVTTSSDEITIALRRVPSVRIRVVDSSGAPIPGAQIQLHSDAVAMDDPSFGQPHPSSTLTFRPLVTDPEGRAVWESPFAQVHAFVIRATGFLENPECEIPADGKEHTAVLPRRPVIRATVVDAATGSPLPRFHATFGRMVGVSVAGRRAPRFRPASDLTGFHTNGDLRRELHFFPSGTPRDPWIAVRIDTAGYRPFVSEPIRIDQGDVSLRFAIQPGSAPKLTILDPQGRPAVAAQVACTDPMGRLILRNKRLTHDGESPYRVQTTDAQGSVILDESPAATRLVIAHPDGYFECDPADLDLLSPIHLLPWSAIDATVVGSKRSIQDASVKVTPWPLTRWEYEILAEPTSHADGRFTFEGIPPREVQVHLRLPADSAHSAIGQRHTVIPEPGTTVAVTFALGGHAVRGRVLPPSGIQVSSNTKLQMTLSTDPGPPLHQATDPLDLMAWAASPKGMTFQRERISVGVQFTPDGAFTATGLPPGDYYLTAKLDRRRPDGRYRKLPPPLAVGQVAFTLPDEVTPIDLDLGEVILRALTDHH